MSQPRRVIIVDDRRAVRQGLQALLAYWPGVACVGEAANAQEGIKLVAEQRPDVVLMDIRMRGMDGLEATRRIKSQWPEVRVIVLTMRVECENEALAAGADAFLVKGGPPESLRDAICMTSAGGDGGGGGSRQQGDRARYGSSMRFDLPRKDTGCRPDNKAGMMPWYAGIAAGREMA